MPGIHRHSRIGILDINSLQDKPPVHYCAKCEEVGTISILGARIYTDPEITTAPLDADNWKQCHNCGTIYGEPELRGEGELQIQNEFELVRTRFEFADRIIKPVYEKRKIDRSGQQLKGRKKKYRAELEKIPDKDIRAEIEKGGKITEYSITKG